MIPCLIEAGTVSLSPPTVGLQIMQQKSVCCAGEPSGKAKIEMIAAVGRILGGDTRQWALPMVGDQHHAFYGYHRCETRCQSNDDTAPGLEAQARIQQVIPKLPCGSNG